MLGCTGSSEHYTLGHTVHCLGNGFKSDLPIGPFLSDMLILFNGMGIEYILKRQLGVICCGRISRVLDWKTNGLGSILVGLFLEFLSLFFFF